MPDTLQTSADVATAQDAKKLARENQKSLLIAEIVVLQARGKAVKDLIDVRKARLLLLLKGDGDARRRTAEGSATMSPKRKFVIHDLARLQMLFSADVLSEQIKVSAAFYDAAKKSDVAIDEAVSVETDETFKVERCRTADEKERIDRIMDETKLEMERRIEALARRMMTNNSSEV